jgi:hypothetical protein
MCYGDPFYGSDGHYLRVLEEEDRREYARRQEAEREADDGQGHAVDDYRQKIRALRKGEE